MMNEELPPSFEDLEPEGDSFAGNNGFDWKDQFDDEDLDTKTMGPLGEYELDEYDDMENLAESDMLDDWEALFRDEFDESDIYHEKRPVQRSTNKLAITTAQTIKKWIGRAEPSLMGSDNGYRPKLTTLTQRQAQICSAQVLEGHKLLALLADTAVKANDPTQAMNLMATAVPLTMQLTPSAARALWPVLPILVAGIAGLTRLLYQKPNSRPIIRQLPDILVQTSRKLSQYAQQGQKLNKRLVATVLVAETEKILSNRMGRRSKSGRSSRRRYRYDDRS
jgi:hypothetical protein